MTNVATLRLEELSDADLDTAQGGISQTCVYAAMFATGATFFGLSVAGGPIGAAIGNVSGGIGFISGVVGTTIGLYCDRLDP